MDKLISNNPIVEKIVSGQANEDVIQLALKRELPLTDEEFLESLVFLLKDERFKARALMALKSIPSAIKANYIRKSRANHRVSYYILSEALILKDEKLVAVAIRNQNLPIDFLIKVAQKGTTEMLEILLENQIKLIAFPEIMEAMETNPNITNFIKGKITEIRDFYLNNDKKTKIASEEITEDILEIVNNDLSSEDDNPLMLLEDSTEKSALSLLQIINNMTTSERIRLALTGSRSHRMILAKDPNKMVATSVLESPKISIHEVLLMVKNRSTSTDLVTRISAHREWTKSYEVSYELVMNPKTPVKNAMSFIKKLHLKDLLTVIKDKNISPVIRNLALNFHRERSKVKK